MTDTPAHPGESRGPEIPADLMAAMKCVALLLAQHGFGPIDAGGDLAGLDWIIAGGESGPGARPPHPDWFRSLRDQCEATGVPFFFKQWGSYAPHNPATDEQAPQDALKWVRLTAEDETRTPICSRPSALMRRLGKTNAGRTLDGREHLAFPAVIPDGGCADPGPSGGHAGTEKAEHPPCS